MVKFSQKNQTNKLHPHTASERHSIATKTTSIKAFSNKVSSDSKTSLIVVKKLENENSSAKLSKQQKRDLKRNGKSIVTFERKINTESVYKRSVIRPDPFITTSKLPRDRFITPADESFDAIVATSYAGFVMEPSSSYSAEFRNRFRNALDGLENDKIYQIDVTQPAGLGTKLAKTFVTRCLVGIPGITYKYLGIRMFAIPWTEGEKGSNTHTVEIGKLNDLLIKRSLVHLQNCNKSQVGSCEFNLTLINRCYPENEVLLKDEPMFQKEKCSVSWHADSSLEHYSTIAVFHCTKSTGIQPYLEGGGGNKGKGKGRDREKRERNHKINQSEKNNAPHSNNSNKSKLADNNPSKHEQQQHQLTKKHTPIDTTITTTTNKNNRNNSNSNNNEKSNIEWRIALRVVNDVEGPSASKRKVTGDSDKSLEEGLALAPPVAVPLPDESCYYMLDDFNHHHQHSVLPGTSHRISSTHRVSRTDGHTYQWIRSRCCTLLQSAQRCDPQQIRSEQLMINELEFEWIRQFYVQGQRHYNTHSWWHEPMMELCTLWSRLEIRTMTILNALRAAADQDLVLVLDIHDQTFHRNSNSLSSKSSQDDVEQDLDLQRKNKKQRNKLSKLLEGLTSYSYDSLRDGISERATKRSGWLGRESDPMFNKMPEDYRPLPVPLFTTAAPSPLPSSEKDLELLGGEIDAMKAKYLLKNS